MIANIYQKVVEDMKDKIIEIVKEVNSHEGKIPEHIIDSMFELHNQLFPGMKEFNKGCGKCRRRTYGRIQTYYNNHILNS